jgi:uncharacterized Zn finger protein
MSVVRDQLSADPWAEWSGSILRARRYWEYPKSKPRIPANGIRAQTQRGAFGKTWWAGRWIAALEQLVDPGRLSRGRSYARSGQVVKLDVGPKGIEAQVQGSRPRPYRVQISFARLSDAAWEQVIEAMSAEALYAAKLLAGEMPEQIEEVFRRAGTSLFPSAKRDLVSECSCPDWANPCKHTAAVHYLLGERFEADPFLMFLLRGRSKDEIIAALRARRTDAAIAEDLAVTEDLDPSDEPEDLAAFWELAPPIVNLSLDPPSVDALPVKRLGPSPFWPEPEEFTRIMESAYRTIAAEARRLATGEDPSPQSE